MAVSEWAGARVRHASVIILAGAAILGGYLLLERPWNVDPGHDTSRSSSLHRSNAIRRRRRRSGSSADLREEFQALDGHRDPLPADDASTDVSIGDIEPQEVAEGQRLAELVYEIAKEKSKHEGMAHRGTYCDSCNQTPIRGIRYHCANCPDFDFCETCEASAAHIKTHVFYKIRIPAPWAQKQSQQTWYPGKPHLMPAVMPRHTTNKLKDKVMAYLSSEQCANIVNELEGYYQQFSCMANTEWKEDPNDIGMAMNRDAFLRCAIPQNFGKTFPPPNLVHERLFDFYDVDRNGLVGFEEFLVGNVLSRVSKHDVRLERVFRALDLNNDGYVSRKDFLMFFRAYYELQRNMVVDNLLGERRGEHSYLISNSTTLRDYAYGGRPLASYFNYAAPHPGMRSPDSAHQGKRRNVFGDYVPKNEGERSLIFEKPEDDLIDRRRIIGHSWISTHNELFGEVRRILAGKHPLLLHAEDVRVFDVDPIGDSDWAEGAGFPWIKAKSLVNPDSGPPLWLRVREHELAGMDWRSKVHEKFYFDMVNLKVMRRLYITILDGVQERAKQRLCDRSMNSQYHLDDEQNFFPDVLEGRAEDATTDEIPRFVGDTAALHTIYTVIQEALNDLLDPLFEFREALYDKLQDQDDVDLSPYQDELDRLHAKILKLSEQSQSWVRTIGYMDEQSHGETDLGPLTDKILEAAGVTKRSINLSDEMAVAAFKGTMNEGLRMGTGHLLSAIAPEMATFMAIVLVGDDDDAAWRKMPVLQLSHEEETPESSKHSSISSAFTSASADEDNDTPANDPTLPQNRPSSNSTTSFSTSSSNNNTPPKHETYTQETQDFLQFQDMIPLLTNRMTLAQAQKAGGPGRLDFGDFKRCLESLDDFSEIRGHEEKLMKWVASWLDLVVF